MHYCAGTRTLGHNRMCSGNVDSFSEQYCTGKVVYNSWKNSRNGGGKFSLNMGVVAAESGWEAREMKDDDNYDDGDGREA